jgi:hypothetical protein
MLPSQRFVVIVGLSGAMFVGACHLLLSRKSSYANGIEKRQRAQDDAGTFAAFRTCLGEAK